MERATEGTNVPAFSPQGLMELYVRGRHDELSEQLIAVLRYFRGSTYRELDANGQRFVNRFMTLFLTLFTQADYQPRREHLLQFVWLNATISNLAALSCLGGTSPYLALVEDAPKDLGKRLTLLSARNTDEFRRVEFFDADPVLASLWYGSYAQLYNSGVLREEVCANLRTHFADADERLDARHAPLDAYFASTYSGQDGERVVKQAMNGAFRRLIADQGIRVRNQADPRKIAVITGNWRPGHSVYRICRAFVEALEGYDLTLVTLGQGGSFDTGLFREVLAVETRPDGAVDVRPLLDNTFGVVYYPDVGLKAASVLLSNLRLAPVQITSMGHPASTWGSEIDYFVSGAEAETADHPERNYSERLVLLPGCGAVHERPDFNAETRARAGSGAEIILNCPWNAQKLNDAFARTLRAMLDRARRPIVFRLFVNRSLDKQNDFLPFVRDIEALLGRGRVEVLGGLTYREYMARMAEGDLTIDSHPFGGCNSVADSLFLRKLTVTYESDRWYGRIGSWMVRQAGLPELAARSEAEYLDVIHRLVHEEEYRAVMQERLDNADLDGTVFARDEGAAFRRAVDFLVANHERLKVEPDRSPICIGR